MPQLVDVDQTSGKGFWSGGEPALTQCASAVRAKVLSKNIGTKGHARVCKAAAGQHAVA